MGIFLYVDWAPDTENTKASIKGRLEEEPKRFAWIPRKCCMGSGEHYVEVTEEWAKMAKVDHLGFKTAAEAEKAGLPPSRRGPTVPNIFDPLKLKKQQKQLSLMEDEDDEPFKRLAAKRRNNADW